MVYKFRNGSNTICGVHAETAWNEMQRIAEENGGGLQPQTLVDESRPEEAPMHPMFEWDNEAAGEEWRKHQARQIIRSVVVYSDGDATAPVNMMVNVSVDEGRAYKPADTIVNNKDEVQSAREFLLEKQEAALRAFDDFERIMRVGGRKRIPKTAQHAGVAIRGAVEAVRALATI